MKVRGVIDPRREDGVAMTEFALILPIFMLIVAGMLGFGRVFFYWIQANHVANETARWAIVDHNPYDPTTLQQHRGEQSPQLEFDQGVDSSTTVCIQREGAHSTLAIPSGHGAEAVHLRPDPRYRQDHDPGLLDDASRELPGRRTPTLRRGVPDMSAARRRTSAVRSSSSPP